MKNPKIKGAIQCLLFFSLFLVIILSSCSGRKCFPPPNSIFIYLNDKNDSLLIGTKYSPDSIRLMVDNKTLQIKIDEGELNVLYSGFNAYNDLNYYLYLSSTDTDTINLKILMNDTDCGPEYHCNELKYNSKVITPKPNTYLVHKILKE
jgi:hypothetical protein